MEAETPNSVLDLLPQHLCELRASGLTDATISAAGLKSETNHARQASLLSWRSVPKRMGPAIVFTFIDADGRNGYCRLKFDNPRQHSGNPVKYESPRGQPNRVYIPPGVTEILHRPDAELLITEGEKKSLKAKQEGFNCIGLVGVFGWKDKRGHRLLAELECVAWAGRTVFLVFDSDAVDNENVRDAESRLAKLLIDRGAQVRIVRLPTGPAGAKVGLDDYLVAQGANALRKRLDAAQDPEPIGAVEMKAPAHNADPCDEAARFLAGDKRDGLPTLLYWRGTFWRWRGGCWRELHSDDARGMLVRWLNRSFSALNTGIVGNHLDQLKAQAGIPFATEPPAWMGTAPWPADEMLAAQNGLIHLPSFVEARDKYRVEPTPRFFTTTALDFDFAEAAAQPVHWLAFLRQLWRDDEESIGALQEWFGYCLTPDTRQQKILMVIGPKRSGKGTLMRVKRAILGRENVAGPTLASFATNFGLWPLLGKSAAIINDARLSGRADQAVVVERLLAISGEDAQTVDRKHLEPLTAKISARLAIVSNELPRLSDASGALTSRMILLRLTESFYGREDHELTDRLLTELPGILRWSIEGWRRLGERGRFLQPAASMDLLDDLGELSSPIAAFLKEVCIVDPGRRVAVEDIYREWQRWCEAKGRKKPGTEQTFGRDLAAAVPTLKKARPRDGDYRYRAYDGIGLRLI